MCLHHNCWTCGSCSRWNRGNDRCPHKLLYPFPCFQRTSWDCKPSSVHRGARYAHPHHVLADWRCDTVCQLRANSAHATWTSVGNVTVDGVVHNLHFSHNGKILRLRSVQGVSGNLKRDDVDDDGRVVAAYFWEDDNQTA